MEISLPAEGVYHLLSSSGRPAIALFSSMHISQSQRRSWHIAFVKGEE